MHKIWEYKAMQGTSSVVNESAELKLKLPKEIYVWLL